MAKRIASYRFSKRFKKEYKSLPKNVQKTFDEKLTLFLKNMDHPSLRVKRIQGTRDRWEGSVTMKYRFTACPVASENGTGVQFDNDIAIFRAIGTHDILEREATSTAS